MGIDFTRKDAPQPAQPSQAIVVQPTVNLEKEEPKPYDIAADRAQMTRELVNSAEIDKLTSEISVHDVNTIVTFGGETANQIAQVSDSILRSTNMSQLDDSVIMLNALKKVMDQFDAKELQRDPGMLDKLFAPAKKTIDKILAKYTNMGSEVDKIYVQLKSYEAEIIQSNRKLEEMFETNVEYYHSLVKYILAGEQAEQELQAYISQRRSDMEATGDSAIQFDIQAGEQALALLEQRVQDLRTAESVAMQSIPLIKTMEFSNLNLIRKIDSAFIVTLPVFKQSLAQAIMLKRQKIQADALSALDDKTNELLIKNAQNAASQSKAVAHLVSGSSIKVETLETTWATIMQGIQETKQVQDEAKAQRADAKARLENLKKQYYGQFDVPQTGSTLKKY
ncbi:MAG: toxic anion resistance protein [Clostridia bacterium]|nr:toxic anion resistance protein [Clostridia bacterium]